MFYMINITYFRLKDRKTFKKHEKSVQNSVKVFLTESKEFEKSLQDKFLKIHTYQLTDQPILKEK